METMHFKYFKDNIHSLFLRRYKICFHLLFEVTQCYIFVLLLYIPPSKAANVLYIQPTNLAFAGKENEIYNKQS